jgi:hypothetical protein
VVNVKPAVAAPLLSLALLATPADGAAPIGACDANPPFSSQACLNAVAAGGGVVNDVFRDANGLTADQLPVKGRLFNNWPNCPDGTAFAGCAATALPPYDCPGQYICSAPPNTFAAAAAHGNDLDRRWWQSCRLADPTLAPIGAGGALCPDFTNNCITDGVGGNYLPWAGQVFDLGQHANQVAILAANPAAGPTPCVSLAYTVFLTNNPFAHGSADIVLDPAIQGHDPDKWNRAALIRVFTQGWIEIRPPDPIGHAACGDVATYSVEMDLFVTVFSLPAGVALRYAAVVAGNDGLDLPECSYQRAYGQVDAVAGLKEDGTGLCDPWDPDVVFADGFESC